MAYTLGNKCAKNLCKRIVLLQLIIENVVTCFFWNTVYIKKQLVVSFVHLVESTLTSLVNPLQPNFHKVH